MATLQGPHRASADLAGRSRLRRQAASSSSAPAPPPRPSSRPSPASARHVTMLQRTPTFFRTGRNAIEIADELRELELDETWIHEIVRRKILRDQDVFTRRTFSEPETVQAGTAGRRARASRRRLRHRHALHPELPALAAAHRLHPRRRPVPGDPPRQGLGRDRRDRAVHRAGIQLKSGKHARRRHRRDRHRLPPERARATSTSRSTARRWISPTPSPIAA